MGTQEFSNIISTLLANGFHIQSVDRFSATSQIIHTYKYDKLGAQVRYSMLFCEDKKEGAILQVLERSAKTYQSLPLVVNDYFQPSIIKVYTKATFFSFFGGMVNTGLILVPDLADVLDQLGHNQLPNDLSGSPEDLLELYSSECLQYILESPTRRYGSDRLFEKLPDGVVLCNGGYMILFDAKAYANGFDFDSKTINSLTGYVLEFTSRYSGFFGNIFSVIVISGHFNDSKASLEGRSEELYRSCNTKISILTARELGNTIQLIKHNPDVRRSINWKNVFSNVIVQSSHVQKEINRIKKDQIH